MKLSTLVLILLHLVPHSATRLNKMTLDLDVRSYPGFVPYRTDCLQIKTGLKRRSVIYYATLYFRNNHWVFTDQWYFFYLKFIAPSVMLPILCSEVHCFKSLSRRWLSWLGGFHGCTRSLQTNDGEFPQMRQLYFPSTSRSIHYSLNHIIQRYPVSNI